MVYSTDNGLQMYIDPKEVSHDSVEFSDKGLVFSFILDRDSDGFIRSMSEQTLKQSFTVEEFLAHYGTKGMRWGVRTKRSGVEIKEIGRRKKAAQKRRTLSEADLDSIIGRLQKEKKLKELVSQDVSPGKTAAKAILSDTGQKVVRTVAAGSALYIVKKVVDKKFGEEAGKVIARGGFPKKG
jgi:hypothetical protein